MTPTDEPRKAYPRGTYSKIARKLGITPQTVRLVAIGSVTSARVTKELRRVERNQRRRVQKPTQHEESAA